MLVELDEGLRGALGTPKYQLVVIAARGQLLVIEGPFKTTNLLTMTDEFCRVIQRAAQVPVQDAVILASCAEERVVPGDSTDTSIMTTESPHESVPRRVPDLELARVRAHCK